MAFESSPYPDPTRVVHLVTSGAWTTRWRRSDWLIQGHKSPSARHWIALNVSFVAQRDSYLGSVGLPSILSPTFLVPLTVLW
jgi:hypothetical protein